MKKCFIRSLIFSIAILGECGIALNSSICYCTETLGNDLRSQYMTMPALSFYESYNYALMSSEKYPNYIKSKYDIAQFLNYCKKEEAVVLNELIKDFTITCNKIAYPLLYGSQMQYKKDNYKKSGDMFRDWTRSFNNILGFIINETEDDSATFFNKTLFYKNITVSSDFLKKIDEAIKDTDFKVFDNPNYVTQDINLGKLFKYLGNRIIEY